MRKSAVANQIAAQVSAGQVSAGRAACVALRAARAQRRLALTLVLLGWAAGAWGLTRFPKLMYPWWYFFIPAALLVLVLVLGRNAAKAIKAADQVYFAQLAGGQGSEAHHFAAAEYVAPVRAVSGLPVAAHSVPDGAAYSQYNVEPGLTHVNEAPALPVPATQLIPEAEQLMAVMENLKDDPEFETRWSLGSPQVPAKRNKHAKAKYDIAG